MEQNIKLTKSGSFVFKITVLFLLYFFCTESGWAQQIAASGSIKNVQGQSMAGVTIIVKGTKNGTYSDADGNFSLGNIASNATLVFSFIGMKTQERSITGTTAIDIVLEEEDAYLEEVIAIGYGTAKKKDLTGSVVSVSGETLSKKQSPQLSNALQGTMAGVTVSRTSGAANKSATIKIRGITTINNSDPLVIIDGIPGDIDNVNANDVESISVLKDAASAAIYGSRAASGVILITTKRAKSGINLTYNAVYGRESPTAIPKNETAVEYMRMYNEMAWNDNGNIAGSEYTTYSQDQIKNYPDLNKENPDLHPDVDWMKVMLRNYAPRQSHLISLNAGTKNIGTKASFAYDKVDALFSNQSYQRFTIRANNDITINKYLSASVDLHFIRTINELPPTNFANYVALRFPPIYAPVWRNGTYGPGTTTGLNQYPFVTGDAGYDNTGENTIGGKVSLDFKPVDGLKISAIFSPNYMNNKEKLFRKKVPYYNWDDPNNIVGYITGATKTSLQESRNDSYTQTAQFLANYSKDIGKHKLNALVGFESYYYMIENLSAARDQYELDDFPYLDLGPLTFRENGGNASELASRSWFGRVMYGYDDKYLIQANGRYDASSRFASEYRWSFFPSVSIGWVASKESFMKDIKNLSHLKFRASLGTLGNDRIGTYPYQSTLSLGSTLFYRGNDIASVQRAYVSGYAIRDISWETTKSYDIGVDVSLFENKLTASGDYYKKITSDMLLALEIPDFMGLGNPDQNTGNMHTTGWDLEIGWKDRIGDFRYSVSANVSDFKSKIGDIGGTEFLGSQVKFKGSEFNEWYGYLSQGLYQTQEEVDNSPTINGTVSPGDVKYKDISGPDGVPDGVISPEYDRTLLGGSLPRYLYGGNIQLNYKNFDFSIAFQGVGKQNSYITYAMVQPRYGAYKLIDGNYWSTYNTVEQNKNIKYPRLLTAVENNYSISDFWLFNGAYLRLKNIMFGYTLPSSTVQKLQIQNARIYCSLTDLYSINNYPTGYDPEGTGFIINKSLNLGISISF